MMTDLEPQVAQADVAPQKEPYAKSHTVELSEVGESIALIESHPLGAQILRLALSGVDIISPRDTLRTLAIGTDGVIDTTGKGGWFYALSWGKNAAKHLAERFAAKSPGTHGSAGLLTQWETKTNSEETTYTKRGGTYFEQEFPGIDVQAQREMRVYKAGDGKSHAQVVTSVTMSSKDGEPVQLFPRSEHPYLQGNYNSAYFVVKDPDGGLRYPTAKSFAKGKDLNDGAKPADIEHTPGEIWYMPEGEGGRVVVMKVGVSITNLDGNTNSLPYRYWLFHQPETDSICIEPVVGSWDEEDTIPSGAAVTQTMDISLQ